MTLAASSTRQASLSCSGSAPGRSLSRATATSSGDKSRMRMGDLPLEWWSAGAIVSAHLGERVRLPGHGPRHDPPPGCGHPTPGHRRRAPVRAPGGPIRRRRPPTGRRPRRRDARSPRVPLVRLLPAGPGPRGQTATGSCSSRTPSRAWVRCLQRSRWRPGASATRPTADPAGPCEGPALGQPTRRRGPGRQLPTWSSRSVAVPAVYLTSERITIASPATSGTTSQMAPATAEVGPLLTAHVAVEESALRVVEVHPRLQVAEPLLAGGEESEDRRQHATNRRSTRRSRRPSCGSARRA